MDAKQILACIGEERAANFSEKGLNFLGLRTRGSNKELSTTIVEAYGAGKIDKIPARTMKEAGAAFGIQDLTPEEAVIILLGRPPSRNRDGKLQEAGKIWAAGSDQETAANTLAEKIKIEHPYVNVRRAPATETSKKAPAAKAETKEETTGTRASV